MSGACVGVEKMLPALDMGYDLVLGDAKGFYGRARTSVHSQPVYSALETDHRFVNICAGFHFFQVASQCSSVTIMLCDFSSLLIQHSSPSTACRVARRPVMLESPSLCLVSLANLSYKSSAPTSPTPSFPLDHPVSPLEPSLSQSSLYGRAYACSLC